MYWLQQLLQSDTTSCMSLMFYLQLGGRFFFDFFFFTVLQKLLKPETACTSSYVLYFTYSLEADFFTVLARAFNNSSSLNGSTLCDILELILSSPFDPTAAATLVTAVSGDSDGRLLASMSAMLHVLTSAEKISTTVLTQLLETLCQ